jgi:hypothetical protein
VAVLDVVLVSLLCVCVPASMDLFVPKKEKKSCLEKDSVCVCLCAAKLMCNSFFVCVAWEKTRAYGAKLYNAWTYDEHTCITSS